MSFLFDVSDVETSDDFDLIPNGKYQACIMDAELKETKNKDGSYISCKWKILGPKHAGRFIFQNYNWDNKNETAKKIGRGEIKKFLLASGRPEGFNSPLDLCGCSCEVEVTVEKSEGYADKNKISKYFKDQNGTSSSVKSNDSEIPGF